MFKWFIIEIPTRASEDWFWLIEHKAHNNVL